MKRASHRTCWLLIPACVAVLFHFPALFCDFVWDDTALVQDHPHLGDPQFLTKVFTRDYGLELGVRRPVGYYRPLFMLVNHVVYRTFGPNPFAYHAISLFLFCCCATLVTCVCRALTEGRQRAFALAAGCVFAAHPARTGTVSLFMSLPDLLMEVYALLVIMFLARCHVANRTREARRCPVVVPVLLCAVISCAAALTKESGFFIMSALCVTGVLYGLANRATAGRLLWTAAGIPPGLALAYGLSVIADIHREPLYLYFKALFFDGSGRALWTTAAAAGEIVLPSRAVFLRASAAPANLLTSLLVPALIAVLVSLVLAFVARRRLFPALISAWLAAGTVNLMLARAVCLPYSQRYLAVAPAVIGLCMLVRRAYLGFAGRFMTDRHQLLRQRVLCLGIAAYVCMHGAFTLAGSAKCMSSVSFFTFMADEDPLLDYPRIALAKIMFYQCRNMAKMEGYAGEAIAISPDKPEVRQLGKLLAKRRMEEAEHDKAIRHLNWCLEAVPDDAEAYALKAVCQANMGRMSDAQENIDRAVALNPDFPAYRELSARIRRDGEERRDTKPSRYTDERPQ